MRLAAGFVLILLAAACSGETAPDGPKAGDPGTYTRMMPDGARNLTIIRSDGTYETEIGKSRSVGKVRSQGDQTCFKGSSEGAVETCWTNGPIRPGGTFESTDLDGQTYTITYSPDVPVDEIRAE